MGGVFSVEGYYRNKGYPKEWGGKPEEYEALKEIMYERIGKPNEIYQMLLGIDTFVSKGINKSTFAKEFVSYGYVDLVSDIVKKYWLNDDILIMSFTLLRNMAEASSDAGTVMVHSYGSLKLLLDIIPKLIKENLVGYCTASICILSQFYSALADVDAETLYKRMFKLIAKYNSNVSICSSAVTSMAYTLNAQKNVNIPLFVKLGGTEKICSLFSTYITNDNLVFYCATVLSILSFAPGGALDVVQMGGIELLIEYVKTGNDPDSLGNCIHALQNIFWESTSTRLRALDLGVVNAVERVAHFGGSVRGYVGFIALSMATLFAVDATFKRGERERALNIVNYLFSCYSDNKRVEHGLSILSRREDPRACKCRNAQVCSRTEIKKCGAHGGFMYCEKCGVPQFMFKCTTCGDPFKVYCLVCKERCHKGHKGETFFFTAHCDCENSECCTPSATCDDDKSDDDDN